MSKSGRKRATTRKLIHHDLAKQNREIRQRQLARARSVRQGEPDIIDAIIDEVTKSDVAKQFASAFERDVMEANNVELGAITALNGDHVYNSKYYCTRCGCDSVSCVCHGD